MNNQDYEKVKEECWNELRAGVTNEVTLPREKYVFNATFNRAYRLGMEAAKKEMLTANVVSMAVKHHKHRPCENPLAEKTSCRWLYQNSCLLSSGCYYEPYTEPQADKHFDNIIKDGFRSERRLNIATQILCAIIPMFDNKYGESELTKDGEQTIVRNSFRLADMMIEESEKKGGHK